MISPLTVQAVLIRTVYIRLPGSASFVSMVAVFPAKSVILLIAHTLNRACFFRSADSTCLRFHTSSQITIDNKIGSGAFGDVYRARLWGTDVAVKTLRAANVCQLFLDMFSRICLLATHTVEMHDTLHEFCRASDTVVLPAEGFFW